MPRVLHSGVKGVWHDRVRYDSISSASPSGLACSSSSKSGPQEPNNDRAPIHTGTIVFPINNREVATIEINPAWQKQIIDLAQSYHADIEALDAAKQRFLNPSYESGDTALIRESIRQNPNELLITVIEALSDITKE